MPWKNKSHGWEVELMEETNRYSVHEQVQYRHYVRHVVLCYGICSETCVLKLYNNLANFAHNKKKNCIFENQKVT